MHKVKFQVLKKEMINQKQGNLEDVSILRTK